MSAGKNARSSARPRRPVFRRSLRFQGAGTGWHRGILSLPKLGVLKLAESLPSVDRPDLVTLTLDAAGRYFVSFCAEVEKEPLSLCCRPSVGVDLGLTHLATLSTGEKIDNPKHYQARLRYLRQQQRCLARRQKGSRRRERQKLRVARAHAKVRQARQYALHELTTRLTQEFDVIGHKILIEVDRWYASSKTCSNCRHVLDELRLDVGAGRAPNAGYPMTETSMPRGIC